MNASWDFRSIAARKEDWEVTFNGSYYSIKVPETFRDLSEKLPYEILRQIILIYGPLKNIDDGYVGPFGNCPMVLIDPYFNCGDLTYRTVPLSSTAISLQQATSTRCRDFWISYLQPKPGMYYEFLKN